MADKKDKTHSTAAVKDLAGNTSIPAGGGNGRTPPISKRERFKKYAPARLKKALNALRQLGNAGKRSGYQYTPEEAEQIVTAVNSAVRDMAAIYRGQTEAAPAPVLRFSDE